MSNRVVNFNFLLITCFSTPFFFCPPFSRLRKSLRQKEEFLCSASSSSSTSPLHSSAGSVGPARSTTTDNVVATASRLPQRIATTPVWPPAIPASSVPQPLPKEVIVRHQQHSPGKNKKTMIDQISIKFTTIWFTYILVITCILKSFSCQLNSGPILLLAAFTF